VDKQDTYAQAAERDMTLAGFAAFLRYGHELKLRKYVQHGRGVPLPALPTHASDANSAE
jgi:hypothetical protein